MRARPSAPGARRAGGTASPGWEQPACPPACFPVCLPASLPAGTARLAATLPGLGAPGAGGGGGQRRPPANSPGVN